MESQNIPIKDLVLNTGQIEGLPKNPRLIKDHRFDKLKKSILDHPEMLELRELLVFPFKKKFVVIAGNMRLQACKALGYEFIPCKQIDESTPIETLKAYVIKDNVGYGEDDYEAIFNEWDVDQLIDWGMEIVIPMEDDLPEQETIGSQVKLIVECELPNELEKLFKELQNRGFVCELK